MIVTVPFRGKHVAVEIDEEDLPLFERYRWRILEIRTKNGTLRYLRTTIQENGKSRTLLFHREVLGVRDRSIWVDHENDEGLDNRRANLRRCLPGQNIANKRVHVRNKSGYRGVYPTTRGRSYYASIRIDKRLTYIGSFADPVEAARAYDARAREVWGEFARCNFPEEAA